MSKSSLTPSSVSQKLSTTPLVAHPANNPATSTNKSGRHSFAVMLHLVVAGTELGDDDPFILYWYCLLWLHSQVYKILKTGGEDGKIQMWKDTPLDSSGFKDVDGDVGMMIAPEAYPLSCKNRKRNHNEDEILVRALID